MAVLVIAKPEKKPISLEDAKRHLRIEPDDDSEKDTINDLIDAATAPLDGPNGWLGRALIKQTLELRVPEFPCGLLRLPCPPLLLNAGAPASLSVKYIDTNGAEQTCAADVYNVILGGEWASYVTLAHGKSWPSTRWQEDAVRIRFDCGYGLEPGDVASDIRHAIRLMLSHLDKNREAVASGKAQQLVLKGYDDLLHHKRVL